MKVCAWDLEGPLSHTDFAAEICKLLPETGKFSIKSGEFDALFLMISEYDDYLIENPDIKESLHISRYEPGDTLRLLAPFFVYAYDSRELERLSKTMLGLIPGARPFMSYLRENWEVFVISTSYSQHAHTITGELGIPQDHVYCTDFPVEALKVRLNQKEVQERLEHLVKEIFPRYYEARSSLDRVLDDINDFFWGKNFHGSTFNDILEEIHVRGGRLKELAIEDISRRTNTPISRIIATGDSITDINMLERVVKEGSFGISFNGNEFSLSRANLAVTTNNLHGIQPLFDAWPEIWSFVETWTSYNLNALETPEQIPNDPKLSNLKNFLTYHKLMPKLHDLRNRTKTELQNIIQEQKSMRKQVRGWVGALG